MILGDLFLCPDHAHLSLSQALFSRALIGQERLQARTCGEMEKDGKAVRRPDVEGCDWKDQAWIRNKLVIGISET